MALLSSGCQGGSLAASSGSGGGSLALLQHVEGDMGSLLARDEHGTEGGAHAGGAVNLRELHASQDQARDDLQ